MPLLDWSHPESLFTVVCRPALPKDTPDVLELTSTIWGGEDYVPHVWNEWLEDPHGLLAVAEYGRRVVGLSKLTCLSESQWWLEGLRVHPQYEGRGIASRLHDYLVEHWQANFSGVLRLATASFRRPVQHLSERSGFTRVAELTSYRAEALYESTNAFITISPDEISGVVSFTNQSPLISLTGGLVNSRYRWCQLTKEMISAYVSGGRAWWWRGREGLLLLTEDEEGGLTWSLVVTLACAPESLKAILPEYRRLAGSLRYSHAAWMVPAEPDLIQPLKAAGFSPNWDFSIYVYEKRHPG